MVSDEELLWNAITDSAKRKFDYKPFEEQFSEIGENVPDNLLFKVIVGFASGKNEEEVAYLLFNDILLTGYMCKLDEIKKFVQNKASVLKTEIYLCQLSNSLLQDGADPLAVLNSINPMLN